MKKLFILVVVLILGFVLLSFVVLPMVVSQSEVQNYLKEKIRQKAGDNFEVASIGVGFFPSAFIEVKGIKVFLPNSPDRSPLFEARKIQLYLKVLPLLFKRFEARSLALEGASFYWRQPEKPNLATQSQTQPARFIKITDVNGSIGNLSFKSSSKFKLKGLVYGNKQSVFRVDGTIQMSLEKLKLKVTGADVRFDVQNITLEELIQAGLLPGDTSLASVNVNVKGNVDLVPDSKNLSGNINLMVSKIKVKAPQFSGRPENVMVPISVSLSSDFFWNQQSRVLELRKSTIAESGVQANAFGTISFLAEPQLDISFRMKEINFDQIKKDFSALFPETRTFDISGTGLGNLILKGTPSQMLVHADGDFTQSAVVIPNVFQKPTGRLFTFSAQSYLSGSQLTQGELSAHFGEMALKGAVEKMNFSTKTGEINFITNKFPLTDWNDLVPKLQDLKISGSAKIVANIKGNFSLPKSLKYSAHVTLDQLLLHQSGKVILQGLSGDFDIEPDKFGIQTSKLIFGNSDLELALEVRDLNAPFFQGRLSSSNLAIEDLNALTERMKQFQMGSSLAQPAAPVETAWTWGLREAYAAPVTAQAAATPIPLIFYKAKGNLDLNLAHVSWSERDFENVAGRLDWNYGDLLIRKITSQVGAGGVLVQGSATWKTNPGSFSAHLESQGIPVEELMTKKFITGLLDSTSDFRGYLGNSELVQSSLVGGGAFQVRNGELRGVSLLNTLSLLPSFMGLGKMGKSGATEFSSLDGQFQIAQKAVQFSSLTLQSNVTNASAQGAIGFDKSMYFKGMIEVAGGIGGIFQRSSEQSTPLRFPMEVSGTIEHPKVNISQAALGSNLVQDAFGSVLKKKKSSGSSSGGSGSTASQILQSFLGGN